MNPLPDRIAIVGTSIPGGGAVLGTHLKRFLESKGINVDFYDGNLHTLRQIQKQRSLPVGERQPILKLVIQEIARSLRERKYPLVIAIEREDLLLEELPAETRRFYYCTCSISYERYYGWLSEGDEQAEVKFQKALELERRIYQAADVITFAWNTYETFVRDKVYDGPNIVSHPGLGWYGCEPQDQRVQYQDDMKMVYLGNIFYWSNPDLLGQLTALAPFPIHCYGRTYVPVPGITHKGYAKDMWETLEEYPFGLNSVSTDPLREASFSSKVMAHLSVGLPTFSPSWQRFSHQVDGVVPFEIENFVNLVKEYHQPETWRILSDEAYEQAQTLRWEEILEPLVELL
jgi:hypothetical protein